MLLENETKLNEVKIGSENFTITDKRILYSNGASNAFIGMNELRGAEMSKEKVKYYRFNVDMGVILLWTALISFIGAEIYFMYIKDSILAGVFLSFFIALPITIVVLVVAGIAKSISAKWEQRLLIKITKTDDTFWLNQYYDLSCEDKLKQLSNFINNAIYK